MQPKHMALVLVPVVVIVGYMFFNQNGQQLPPEGPMETQIQETTGEEVAPTTGDEITETADTTEPETAMVEGTVTEVVADDFTFDVKEIRVKQGEKLTVSVMNSKGFHDFVIDELAVNSGMIKAGSTMELEIPTDKPGTYEYYCSVGQHRQMGMKGMLIVTSLD